MSTNSPHSGSQRAYVPRGPRRRRRRSPMPWVIAILLLIVAVGLLLVYRSRGNATPPVQSSDPSSLTGAVLPVGGEPDDNSAPESPSSEPSTSDSSTSADPVVDPTDWRLVLVNAANRLEEDYPVSLAPVTDNYQMDARVVADLQAMIAGAAADGYTLQVYSTYRPMERSRILYENKVSEYIAGGYTEEAARAEAAKWIAPPGTSEHNTGLAVDVVSGDYFTKFADLVHEFDTCPEFTWLYENCAEYGFVLRYPKDKQEVTGITYEPWHYRYVGQEHAAKIMAEGLCLEEYLGKVSTQPAA